jgi:hypothetical protein
MAGRASARVDVNHEAVKEDVGRIGRRVVNRVAGEIKTEAKRIVPVRTGHTRATIGVSPARERAPFLISAEVSAGGAARFLQEGTRPHIIRARRAAALHFYWEKMGREVWFKHVSHPGTRPNPFMSIAAARVAARHR